ncbi:ribonucleotide reductase of class III [Aeromonas phage Ahp1_CNU-2021]|nr:ribonucleotide reductase of class III [Aeromonas phage Ahp1_CNU-2021]
MQVQKRDGRIVNFDRSFIENAVTKAVHTAGVLDSNFPLHVTNAVVRKLPQDGVLSISDIQNAVETVLMKSRYPNVAREYIEYRHDRDQAREMTSDMTKQIDGLMNVTNDDIINENANKDGNVIPTQRDLLAGIVSKHYANHMIPKHIMQAHKSGVLHFHDLDYSPLFPMFNCMLIDIENMMTNGFRMGNAWIETPRSIGTACAVTAQIIAQVASHIYGGNTINRIDEVLAPYVTATHKKNIEFLAYAKCPDVERVAMEKTRKDVYDAIQALEYEVNTMHTANGQTPFCTFGFGLGDSWESALIQESILKIRMAGLGKDKHTAIFPKLVFAIKQGHNANPGDPLYRIKQLALECASKRMYPDIVSYEKIVEQTGSFKFPMGCRSFLHRWTNEEGKEIHEGRNNLGVVTLNLPRIALDSNGDPSKFMDLLDERMELIRQALQVRIDRLKGVKAKVAPILYVEGACGVRLDPEDYVMDIFVNKRASVSAGYIGLHEVSELMNLGDDHVFDSPTKQRFLVDVMERMKSWIQKWNDSSTFAYSLYGTPSESLCDRFCRLDKAVYGDVVPGIFEKGYYTNSFHLDVNKKVNPYEKMIFEKQFLSSTTGGFICYGEFPNMQHNLEALEDVWDFACANVPYYGTNTPIDRCFECGYEGEFEATSKGYKCPSCGNHDDKKMNVTRRVCGYLGSPGSRPFNAGKQCEVQRRVKHL